MKGIWIVLLVALALTVSCEPPRPPKPPPAPPPPATPPPASTAPSRAELQARLEREGHFLKDGRWWKRQAWEWGINNLWDLKAGEVLWTAEGCELKEFWEEVTRYSILGAGPGFPTSITRLSTKYGDHTLRFLAPPQGKGRVTLKVEAPGELLDCKVRAVGEVHERTKDGKVEVSVVPEGGAPQLLYSIDEARSEDDHDITALVKGKRRFTIVADIEEIPKKDTENKTDKVFTWHARFLPSVKGMSRHVLHVQGTVVAPAPDADRAWSEAK